MVRMGGEKSNGAGPSRSQQMVGLSPAEQQELKRLMEKGTAPALQIVFRAAMSPYMLQVIAALEDGKPHAAYRALMTFRERLVSFHDSLMSDLRSAGVDPDVLDEAMPTDAASTHQPEEADDG